jgi:hypothetical protein
MESTLLVLQSLGVNMLLNEFFSKPIDIKSPKEGKDTSKIDNELFWYILDHDKLHKDYFFPIAKKLKSLKECGDEMIYEMFMPMVKKGCKEYYVKNKMEGKLGKIFPAKMREELCKKLYDHYKEDVKKGVYKLG